MKLPSSLTSMFSGTATRTADTTVNMTTVVELLNSLVFIFLMVLCLKISPH